MRNEEKKSPASVAALNRAFQNYSLRRACIILITWELFYSNSEQIYYTGGSVFDIYNQVAQVMERAPKPEAHIGRTNAAVQLTGLIEQGFLNREDAHRLRYVAKLLASEGGIKIDPLFEVARRILAMHLVEGGSRE